jgi:hypothetical protein
MKMTKGKYVDATFTPEQENARKLWRQQERKWREIWDGLTSCPTADRELLHKLLDAKLDHIERIQVTARELFPEVDESFAVLKVEL